MKRSFSFMARRDRLVVAFGMSFIAANYGLVRLAYGLFLPDIQRDLGLGSDTAGYVSSGSSVVYCLGAGLGFVLAQSRSRSLIVAAAVAACAGVWGMSTAGSIVVFASAAVLSSAGAGLASPAMVRVVARNVTARSAQRSQAVVNAGTGPGLIGAGVLALALLPEWRVAWTVVGVVTAVVAVGVLLTDRPDAPDSPGVAAGTEREVAIVRAGSPGRARSARACRPRCASGARIVTRAGDRDAGGGIATRARRIAITRPRPAGDAPTPSRSWLLRHTRPVTAALLLGAASSAVWTYGRSLLVDTGDQSVDATVWAWIAIGIGATATVLTAPALSGLAPRTAWALSSSAMTVAVLTLATTAQLAPVALGAFIVFGWGFTAATSVLIAWTTRIDVTDAASGTALLFVALVLGQAVGSTALGVISDAAGLPLTFGVAAAVGVAATAAALTRPTIGSRPDDRQVAPAVG